MVVFNWWQRMNKIELQINQNTTLDEEFYMTSEGKIFLTGILLFVVYSLWLCGLYFLNPEPALSKVAFSISRLLIGNPAGVFLGYTMGFSREFVIFANMFIDTIVIFILYPLLIFVFREFINVSLLESAKQQFFKTAEIRHKSVKKYGSLGLFLFVLFPLWGTGPVVGSVIGFLMRMNPLVNMSIVLSATYLATVIFSIIFKNVHEFALLFDPKAPSILILLVFTIVVGINLFRWFKKKRKGI